MPPINNVWKKKIEQNKTYPYPPPHPHQGNEQGGKRKKMATIFFLEKNAWKLIKEGQGRGIDESENTEGKEGEGNKF